MRAKEFIPASKPRNPVVRQQQTSGAGAHRDKKKEQKQGYEKHKGKGVAEDAEPMDREFALVKKLGRLGERIVQNSKLWEKYDEAIDNDNIDWIVSLIQDGTGATSDEVTKLSDLFGEIGGGMGRIIDFAWAVKEGTWEEDFMDPYRKHRDQGVEERVRDPEDWDEGNTEPPNNFAIYINGKKWKVFKGRGQFADDYKERDHYRQLQSWVQQKSAQTGKKWEVYVTGEPATESIEEGWKDKLAAAALAGTLGLGAAGGASARVLPGADPSINRFTGQPIATQQVSPDNERKPASDEKIGFSSEYLKKVANGEHPRPMISRDDAKKELERRGETAN